MKELVIREYGSPDHLEIQDDRRPRPLGDQVSIQVKAVSVNDWNWGLLQGSPFVPNRFMAGLFKPRIIMGTDVSGIVESVGPEVGSYEPGDEVFGDLSGSGFGAFAEYVCVPRDAVRLKSPRMTLEEAAAVPHAGMLALQAITAGGEPKSGQQILINGAGGGVGSIAIQLLKPRDIEVTGVDSAAKLDAMSSWGFDHVIDYRSEDFTRRGLRYDVIIDVKTDRAPADYERALKAGGIYATVGGRVSSLLRIALAGVRIDRARHKKFRVVGLQPNRDLAYLNELFEAGSFRPVIDSVFEFTTRGVRDAFRHFGAASQKGKIVVRT